MSSFFVPWPSLSALFASPQVSEAGGHCLCFLTDSLSDTMTGKKRKSESDPTRNSKQIRSEDPLSSESSTNDSQNPVESSTITIIDSRPVVVATPGMVESFLYLG